MVPRLPDRIVLGDRTEIYPPDLVEVVLAKTGRRKERVRLPPARLMVSLLPAKALVSPAPYREVLRTLAEAARRAGDWGTWHLPDKAAIFRARQRIGIAPFRELLAPVGPVATEATPGAFWGNWRLMVIDGTTVEAADTPANEAGLGRPRPKKGRMRCRC